MTNAVRTFSIVIAFVGAAASGVAAEPPTEAEAGAAEPCCFTNPRYSGVCEVTPAEDETCADILAYLNNQASVGKTYCGNTRVRGGWAHVDCDDSGQAAAAPYEEAQQS